MRFLFVLLAPWFLGGFILRGIIAHQNKSSGYLSREDAIPEPSIIKSICLTSLGIAVFVMAFSLLSPKRDWTTISGILHLRTLIIAVPVTIFAMVSALEFFLGIQVSRAIPLAVFWFAATFFSLVLAIGVSVGISFMN